MQTPLKAGSGADPGRCRYLLPSPRRSTVRGITTPLRPSRGRRPSCCLSPRGPRATHTQTHTSGYTHSVLTVLIVHSLRVYCAHYTQTPLPSSSTVCASLRVSALPPLPREGERQRRGERENERGPAREKGEQQGGRDREGDGCSPVRRNPSIRMASRARVTA